VSATTAANTWGRFVPGIAEPDPSAYGGRAARKGGRYNAFVPPNIADYGFTLTKAATSDVETGVAALKRLNDLHLAPALHSLAETLLRSESVASSRIEGLDPTHARRARVRYGDGREDKKAREVIGNIGAMLKAIELGASTSVLGVEAVRDIHRALIRGETLRGKPYAGLIRHEQNWIGGNDDNPVSAIFVPPPPEFVPALLGPRAVHRSRRSRPAVAGGDSSRPVRDDRSVPRWKRAGWQGPRLRNPAPSRTPRRVHPTDLPRAKCGAS
jgi:hypothetical protein